MDATFAFTVAQTVRSLRSDQGGPSRSVNALSGAIARAGATVSIVTRDMPDAAVISSEAGVSVTSVPPSGLVSSLRGRDAALERALRKADVIHDHGVWLSANRQASLTALATGRPLVVSPRGMLSAWALDFKRTRKRLAWTLFQRSLLERASLLHATAQSEADDIRELGLIAPIVVLPNAVDVPLLLSAAPRATPFKRALFLSRLHPKKGLVNLVKAWASAAPSDWELLLVGPEEDGHWEQIQRAAAEAGAERVRWMGEVSDADKWPLYQSADLFVLPTFSENFGIVVAEALAAGVPAIVTKTAPWEVLRSHACGWWIDVGVGPLEVALREATGASAETRREMGRRGRQYVTRELSWDAVGLEMARAYSWLLGHGDRPDSVQLH